MIYARIALGLLASMALPALAVDLEKTSSETKATATAGADLASAYIFRGVTVNKNAALQPALKIQAGGLTAGAWGSFALDKVEAETEKEVDLYASYDIPVDIMTLSLGYTEYMYPDTELDNDQEVMAKISLGTLLNPSIAAFRGIGGGIADSTYYELAAKQEVFAQQGISSTLGGTLGYIDRELGVDGLSHLTLTAAASYQVISASVNYVVETDRDVNDLSEQEQLFVMTGASFIF